VSDVEYEFLTAEQRLQIVEARLQQYEAEHYGHSLNKRALEGSSDIPEADKQQQLEQIERTLASLESSIDLHRRERAAIKGS
jgi:hypothetical protein